MSSAQSSLSNMPAVAVRLMQGIASSPNCILFSLDAEGLVIHCSGAGLDLVDVGKREFIGKSYFDLYKDSSLALEMARKSLHEGEITRFSGRFQERYYKIELYPLPEGGLVGIALDETEKERIRYELEERDKRLLDGLFDGVRDGMLLLDRDLNIIRCNEAIKCLIPQADFGKRHCYGALRSKAERCENCPVQKTFQDGQRHGRVEYFSENDRWLELSSFPIRDPGSDKITTVIEFIRDITEQKKNELEMKRREKFLAAILDSSHDGIIAISDAEGVTHFNPRLKEMFYDDGDLYLGSTEKTIYELQAKYAKNPDDIRDAREKLRKTQKLQQGTLYLKDGRVYEWCAVSVDIGNVSRGFDTRFWTFHDATELYRAFETIQKSERKHKTMQSVIDHISGPIFWLELDGTILYANEAGTALVGFDSPKTLVGKKAWLLNIADIEERWRTFVDRFDDDKTQSFDTVLNHVNGTSMPVKIVADMMELEEKKFIAVCLYDLSDHVGRIEAELASVAKTRYLSHMSHEIRTPLNGVIGMSDLLLETKLTDKQREYAELGRASGRHLLSLINDILDFSKIEAGKLELIESEFDIFDLVESVLGILAVRALDNGLELCGTLSSDIPRLLIGDPGRIRQILVNLMANAVKFTSEGGVKLSLSVDDRTKKEETSQCLVRFEVADTGIGISPEHLKKLFESFYQIQTAGYAPKEMGTGLGLAISKELINLMGGELNVESDGKHGTTFWFTIPLRSGEAKENDRHVFRHGHLEFKDKKVIIAEGNNMLRGVLQGQLEKWGMKVYVAKGKTEALMTMREAKFREDVFQIAIVDSRLEDAPGIELIRSIKSDPALKQTPVILLTPLAEEFAGHNGPEEIDRIVGKPFVGSSLFNAVLGILTNNDIPVPGCVKNADWKKEWKERQDYKKILDNFYVDATSENTDFPEEDRPTVLIAEDNRVNQIVVSEILSNAGLNYDVVGDGRRAVEAAALKKYLLILMDCQMPIMDGIEATRAIREMESERKDILLCENDRVPIIALTANATKEDEVRCREAGMDDFCCKPVEASKLIETIRRHVAISVSD